MPGCSDNSEAHSAPLTTTRFYDARGNIYGVVSPAALRRQGIDLPPSAALAARDRERWTASAVAAECTWGTLPRPADAKVHRCDGLLVGPFQAEAPFDLLIVNTDGSLAERSGNGLSIFAQALSDQGLLAGRCALRVHHDQADAASPLVTVIEPAVFEQVRGFWLTLGRPTFGPSAVGAGQVASATLDDRLVSQVSGLLALDARWGHSQFVRVGNPHCVTLVDEVSALPNNLQMQQPALFEALQQIAFAPPAGAGQPCAAGVNLQWAARTSENCLSARVFERGEGPTASSGTSASAVACAAWRVGWVAAGPVKVLMPGGTAPVLLEAQDGELTGVSLFGTARPQVL